MKKLGILLIALLALILLGMANLDEDEDYPWRNHEPPFNFTFGNMIDNHQQSKIVPAEKEKEKEKEKDKLQGFLYIHYTGETKDGQPVAKRANCYDEPDKCRVGWVLKGVPISATLVNKGPRLWCVHPDDLPKEPGYSHFQWVGPPEKPCGLVIGNEYDGILLKRTAPAPFYWLGGQGEGGGGGSGGCDGHDGGCDGHDGTDGGCGGHDGSDGGSGGSGGQGGSGGHGGRLVPEGVDPHSNIVISANCDDAGQGGGGGCGDDGGCDGGSGGHDGGDCGDDGGCDGGSGGHDGGGCEDEGGCDGGSGGHDGGGCGDEGTCDG